MLKKYGQFLASILALTDVGIALLSWTIAYHLRFDGSGWNVPEAGFLSQKYFLIPILIIIIWPVVSRKFGLYKPRRITSILGETFEIIASSILVILILVSATYFFDGVGNDKIVFVYFAATSIGLLIIERWFLRNLLRYYRKRGFNTRRVLIVGAGNLGRDVSRRIKENPWTGLDVVGFLDDYKGLGEIIEEKKILGRIDDIKSIVRQYRIDEVIVALYIRAYSKLIYVVETLQGELITVRIVPDIYRFITMNAGVEEFEGLPLINLTDSRMHGWNAVLKGFTDFFVSVIALILLAPLMAAIALCIKLTSQGRVIFVQKRYGLDGEEIKVYKFRTMTVCEDGPDIPQASRCDPRVTPFGAFLRRTSLDELPQFINVLQGRMAVVGPRPHAVAHNEKYRKLIRTYMLRHKVKPGITGWAQVNGWRGETDTLAKMEKRVKYDIDYIQNWSLWFDMKIMLFTIFNGFTNKNAY